MAELDYNAHEVESIYLTPEGYHSLKNELEYLSGPKRAEISQRMREYMTQGEHSEDHSELDVIRFDLAITEKRISDLKLIFSYAQVLDQNKIPKDHIGLGSFVTVKDLDRGFEFEVRIVESVEADPDKDLVSCESPMGTALFNKKLEEVVSFQAPAGTIRYKIIKIRSH